MHPRKGTRSPTHPGSIAFHVSITSTGSSSDRGGEGRRGLLPERTARVLTSPGELFYANSVILTSSTFIHLFNWVYFILCLE